MIVAPQSRCVFFIFFFLSSMVGKRDSLGDKQKTDKFEGSKWNSKIFRVIVVDCWDLLRRYRPDWAWFSWGCCFCAFSVWVCSGSMRQPGTFKCSQSVLHPPFFLFLAFLFLFSFPFFFFLQAIFQICFKKTSLEDTLPKNIDFFATFIFFLAIKMGGGWF